MSTLYRTYRPNKFSEILGQDFSKQILLGSLNKNRVAHAYLFTGPRGSGKTTTARIFSKAVNCQDFKLEACDKCPSCVAINQNQTTDLIEIDAASNRSIEDIRNLREQVQYPPSLLKKKVYIIDEVHMLSIDAFNALLKTLEEPPPYVMFILATTEINKVPLTIRSRCQMLKFDRAPIEILMEKLTMICQKENIKFKNTSLELISKHADGGFRDAETLLESLISADVEINDIQSVSIALGVLPEAQCISLLSASLSGDNSLILIELKKLESLSHSAFENLLLQLTQTLRQGLYSQAEWINNSANAVILLEKLLEAIVLHRHSPIPSLALESSLLNASGANFSYIEARTQPPTTSKSDIIPVTTPVKSPITNTSTIDVKPLEYQTKSEQVPVVEMSGPLPDPRQAWKQMVAKVTKENLPLGQTLKDAVLHKSQGSNLDVHLRYKFHVDILTKRINDKLIHDTLKSVSGIDWQVTYSVNDAIPKRESSKQIQSTTEDVKAIFNQEGK